MSQILVTSFDLVNNAFTLDGAEARHVITVLRKKPGDALNLFDGGDLRFVGEIVTVDPSLSCVRGRILERLSGRPKHVRLRLLQGLPRGGKFDYIVEKATELGADAVIPFISEKNLIKLNSDKAESKRSRWQNLALAASKQCDRSSIPSVEPVCQWGELARYIEEGLTLVLDPSGSADMKSIFSSGKIIPPVVNIIIGPESGFSPREMADLEKWGGKRVCLGGRILRTETAGLVILSILNYEMGLFC